MLSGISYSSVVNRSPSAYQINAWQSAIPITMATDSTLFGEAGKPASKFSLRSLWAKFSQAWRKRFAPNDTLYRISDLTPQRIKSLGSVKGIIFDLDDTLMPLLSGRFSDGVLSSLRGLREAGFQMGIVTNNIQPEYCHKVRAELKKEGLVLPFIQDAYKPDSLGFKTMQRHFALAPEEIVVIGDGWLSDVLGAKALGMKSILARWTRQGILGCQPFLFFWDAAVSAVSSIRATFSSRKKIRIFDTAQTCEF